MENQMIFNIINEIYTTNDNNLLLEIMNKLENLLKDINGENCITKIKEIIVILNKVIYHFKKIRKDIQDLNIINNKRCNNSEINIKNNDNNNIQNNKYDNGRYEGQKGIFFYSDDDRYEGDWKNDLREGKGVFYSNNGNIYEGEFKNDLQEGKGIWYYNDGGRNEGDLKNGKKEGKGIYYYKNGDKYKGDWKNDLREGKEI